MEIDRTVPRDQLVVVIPAVWLSKRQQQLYGSKDLVEVADRLKNNEPGPLSVGVDHAVEAILAKRTTKLRKELLVNYKDPSWILEADVPREIRATLWKAGLSVLDRPRTVYSCGGGIL